ncbi:MAG: hypothetical protein QXN17_02750 [Nitrososphaerota archaeon]
MCRRSYMKKGISAVAGGLIILAILFTTIIPLIILMQNSYAIFLNESNSRRIFDTDRISESLAVEVSQDTETKQLVLILSNNGPVYVRVVRVWAIDVAMQRSIRDDGPCLIEEPPSLPPGANSTLNLQHCIDKFTGIVQFLVVTERGRIFSSNRVNLISGHLIDIVFPYTLTLSIINMKRGATYDVHVEPLGEGSVSPETFTYKATASNENVTVAFGVTAGKYRVSLYENGILAKIKWNPRIVYIPDTTAVIFDLGRKEYQSVPLEIIFHTPRKVLVRQSEEESFDVGIWVQLPREALEPVEINLVDTSRINANGPSNIIRELTCMAYSGFILQPGQRAMAAMCTLTVHGGGKPEEKYDLTIIVNEGAIKGNGFYSSLDYENKKTESTPITVQIIKGTPGPPE